MLIVDEDKIAYFKELPPEARPATLDDFHINGNPLIGRPFLCYSRLSKRYVVYRMTSNTRGGRLQFFIDLGHLFVFTTVPSSVHEYLTRD